MQYKCFVVKLSAIQSWISVYVQLFAGLWLTSCIECYCLAQLTELCYFISVIISELTFCFVCYKLLVKFYEVNII